MTTIRSQLLLKYPQIIFGMSTRQGGVSGEYFDLNLSYNVGDKPEDVKENRTRFFSELGVLEEQVAFPRQKHTSNVLICSDAAMFPACDGLITVKENLFLGISVADCVPVILFDRINNVVAAVHAGAEHRSVLLKKPCK